MMVGRWFQHDPWSNELPKRRERAGQEVAGGWRGIVVAHRGDEKYLQKAFHTAVAWNSEQVCWRCNASRVRNSPNLYTYFGPGAPHRDTMIDLDTFITRTSRTNAWVRVPGFHPSMVLFDFLHVFDLTIVPDAAASVTWLLLQCFLQRMCVHVNIWYMHMQTTQALVELSASDMVWSGSSADERLRRAHVDFVKLCRQHKIRSSVATYVFHICSSEYCDNCMHIPGNRGQVFSLHLISVMHICHMFLWWWM